MDAETVFSDLIERLKGRENGEVVELFAQHLRSQGWYAVEGNSELRELALTETDLVEPE